MRNALQAFDKLSPNASSITRHPKQKLVVYSLLVTVVGIAILSLSMGGMLVSTIRTRQIHYGDPPEVFHPQSTYSQKMGHPMTKQHVEFLRGPKGPKWNVLVTGAAGFVGMHTCLELKRLGMTPIGFFIFTTMSTRIIQRN
jgi:hypothetical protein